MRLLSLNFVFLLLSSSLFAQETAYTEQAKWPERLPSAEELSRPQDRRLQSLIMLKGLYSNSGAITRDSSEGPKSVFEHEAVVAFRPIWQARAEGEEAWFYLARFLKAKSDKPMMQLVYRFKPMRGDTFEVETYTIAPEGLLLLKQNKLPAWAEEKPLGKLDREMLVYQTSCNLHYYYDKSLGQYRLQQQEAYCSLASQVGLAKYSFFKFMLDAHSLNIASAFYDERKENISPDKFRYYERMKEQEVQDLLSTLFEKKDKKARKRAAQKKSFAKEKEQGF